MGGALRLVYAAVRFGWLCASAGCAVGLGLRVVGVGWCMVEFGLCVVEFGLRVVGFGLCVVGFGWCMALIGCGRSRFTAVKVSC